jgi:hypothetical protein
MSERIPGGETSLSNPPYQMKVVAVAVTAVAGLVDERADNLDPKSANAALVCALLQIRRAESERIERPAIVDEAYPETARPPPERRGDGPFRRMGPATMRYRVREEFIEND